MTSKVSVLVASGDDGSPGFGATCPIDPLMPVDIGGQGGGVTCPFSNPNDCKCASFYMETLG